MASLRRGAAALAALAGAAGCGDSGNHAPRADYQPVVAELRAFIEHEMADKRIPAISIALVDDQEIVWARGFGYADPDDRVPATAQTVYRVGSVSKLFTDLAVMQLVELGRINLDTAVQTYLPAFTPENPYDTPITLRELMSHRAGLVREPPVGHYFDPTEPSLAATIGSLSHTRLVYPPTDRIKYSNAAIATVGYVLERLNEEPFARYVARAVLDPLRMERSSFEPGPAIVSHLATGYMWSYHGVAQPAPTFQLGMAPAGSMYAPVTDLAWFLTALFAGGQGERGRVIDPGTLDKMFTPQFADSGATSGYGIGFSLGTIDGERTIGHGGAIYGFSTQVAALPGPKLGVAVASSMDVTNAVVNRIADHALRLMRARRDGRPFPRAETTGPVPDSVLAGVAGRYAGGGNTIDIVRHGADLHAWIDRPGFRVRLRAIGDTLVVDDRLWYGPRLVPIDGGLVAGGDTLRRVPNRLPRAAPARWVGLIGEYGWDHNTLFILERDGVLHALIEWFFLYPLHEVSRDVFAFPEWGLYAGERVVFERGERGPAGAAVAAGVRFERRHVGTEQGETFHIDPVTPVADLRAAALAAAPPVQPDTLRDPELVELRALDRTIRYDIRYASTDNFMRALFYDTARAMLQRPAAEALVRVHQRLRRAGYGLLIHDAYRPWYVTKMFWDATPEAQKIFVADPAAGSRHNRGAAVDLTLYESATGRPVEMTGGYDEFSDRSFAEYPGGTSRQRWLRELLRTTMEAEGFAVYEFEWWHFDYRDWRAYPVLNVQFGDVP
ncbi:MAG TPA: serine hydrolase [Gemmatimonadales bacterium]